MAFSERSEYCLIYPKAKKIQNVAKVRINDNWLIAC